MRKSAVKLTAAVLCALLLSGCGAPDAEVTAPQTTPAPSEEADAGPEYSVLPDMSAYPTRIVVDGLPAETGDKPIYSEGEALMPLDTVLELADCGAEAGELSEQSVEIDGVKYVSPEALENVPGLNFAWDPATNTAIIETDKPSGRVFSYDLGEAAVSNSSGREDTVYRIQGVMGVPEGENCPVVIILQGSHPIDRASENRYDLGFGYLVDELAEAGYLAVSMNVGINFSFEDGEPSGCERSVQVVQQQLELLMEANEGEQVFKRDLTGKADFSKVILIGHSRSGTDIYTIAENLEDCGIAGLLSLAPALVTPLPDELPDVPAGIIIPQYDGDVASLDGATVFDALETDGERTAPAELVYLKGGNHGGFSTALVRPDPFADEDSIAATMAAEEQQSFLSQYALEFIASALEGGTVFSQTEELPDSYADCGVMVQVDSPGNALFTASDESCGNVEPDGADTECVNACSTVDNTAGSFRLPGSFLQYGLLRISWSSGPASARIPVDTDLSAYTWLQLDIAQDSSDPLNGESDQSLTVTLTDGGGRSASVDVPAGTPALQWQAGELLERPAWDDPESVEYSYSTFTPLGSLRLSLDSFGEVDLSDIVSVELSFSGQSGSIMLREIQAAR